MIGTFAGQAAAPIGLEHKGNEAELFSDLKTMVEGMQRLDP